MKQSTKILATCIFITTVIIICMESRAENIPDSTLNVTYVGGTGYLIESANYKVLIEPTYGDIIKGFGYPYADTVIENDIFYGEGLFDSIDLFLISHVHDGHFDTEKTLSCFKANKDALLITTSQVFDKLETALDNFVSIKERIYVPDLEFYKMFDTILIGIPFVLTEIDHWGNTTLLQFYFRLDGLGIGYYLDYVPREGKVPHVKTDSLDLCIIDGDMFLNNDRREVYKNDFDIGFAVFTHFNNFSKMEEILAENKAKFPNSGYLKGSMEKIIISKQNNKITIDTVNQYPVPLVRLERDTFEIGQSIKVQFPKEMFTDPDGDELILTVNQSNGESLPPWLNFDMSTMTLTGLTDEEQSLKIRFCATDSKQAWNFTDYTLIVKSTTSSNSDLEVHEGIRIFPTQAKDFLFIDLTNSKDIYNRFVILNMSGVFIKEGLLNSLSLNQVNIEGLPGGNYIIRLHGSSNESCFNFLKN